MSHHHARELDSLFRDTVLKKIYIGRYNIYYILYPPVLLQFLRHIINSIV